MLTHEMNQRVGPALEAIYESALRPDLWPETLTDIALVFDAKGCVLLFNRDDGSTTSIASASLASAGADYNSGWWRQDIRLHRGFERSLLANSTFYTDRDVASQSEIETHLFYTQFLRKHGIGYFMGGSVSPDPKVFAGLSVQGHLGAAPFSDENIALLSTIGRHVERSLRLSLRLMEAEASNAAVAEALSRLRAGVFVVNEAGYILYQNDAATALVGKGLTVKSGKISADEPNSATALVEAVQSACRLSAEPQLADPRPLLVRGESHSRALVIYVLPAGQSADQLNPSPFIGGRALVLVLRQDVGAPPDPALVRDILRITLGEARVASLIATGKSPREVANILGITEETTRTVLKRIYLKTGVSRQSELASLLARVALA